MPKPNHKQKVLDAGLAAFIATAITQPAEQPPGRRVGDGSHAYAEHPTEILTPPRSLAEPFYGNIQRWTRVPRGGHFPALESPDDLAADIRAFFRAIDGAKA